MFMRERRKTLVLQAMTTTGCWRKNSRTWFRCINFQTVKGPVKRRRKMKESNWMRTRACGTLDPGLRVFQYQMALVIGTVNSVIAKVTGRKLAFWINCVLLVGVAQSHLSC